MPRPLLFCNIGWMKEYQGQTDTDKIIGGGQYVRVQKRGEEVCNFVVAGGRVFGYVQPVGSRIALDKLGALPNADRLEGVDIAITAHRPGGDTVVVGWYKNATVYRERQTLREPTASHKANGIATFRYEAKARDVKLLAIEQRTLIVPRGKSGMGQSNVWYAQNASPSWLSRVRRLIDGEIPDAPRRRERPPLDHFKNTKVESAAMTYVWNHYEHQGYALSDVSKENRGWDLEAAPGSLTLRIEVKGLSGASIMVELTPNEYVAFTANSVTYKLCIVTGCLSRPSLTVCTFNPASGKWAVESNGQHNKIAVKERVAATVTVT